MGLGSGSGGHDGSEQRIEVFVKIKKSVSSIFFFHITRFFYPNHVS